MPRTIRTTLAAAAIGTLAPLAGAFAQSDAALTCPQIESQINAQNAIVKHAQRIAKLHANEDTGTTTDPEVTQANSDAAEASTRAQTLLKLGRAKKCFG